MKLVMVSSSTATHRHDSRYTRDGPPRARSFDYNEVCEIPQGNRRSASSNVAHCSAEACVQDSEGKRA